MTYSLSMIFSENRYHFSGSCCRRRRAGDIARQVVVDLDDRPIIVAGIAGVLEQRAPHLGLAEGLGSEHPVEKGVALVIVAIGIDLDVAASGRHPLNFLDCLDAG